MLKILVVIQILSAVAMVVFILLQHGKGADMGAAFGSGSSGSLFGASGSANFLSRTTAVLAVVFFLSTLGQAFFINAGGSSVESQVLEKAFSDQTTESSGSSESGAPAPTGTTAPSQPALPSGK